MEQSIVKTYTGNQANAMAWFKRDAENMAKKGYHPASQVWTPGAYGAGSFILAVLLCVVLIGVLVFVYMLLVKPNGTLAVTYLLQAPQAKEIAVPLADEKTCPQCAEQVKRAAKICRYCGHAFAA